MQRFENKYDLLNAVYQDKNLKKGTITLFQYLVHKSNKEQCFPSVETIAKALNVCKRTVQYNMRKLENAGYIIRKDRYYNHQQLSNQYVFNLGVIEDSTPSAERYSETIKEYMFNVMGISECSADINKAQALLKIYDLPYSSREKLLLIYFYHKANCKGLVYTGIKEVMDAIGVGPQTYCKLLSALRRKGLVKVKYIKIHGKRLLVVKLMDCFMQSVEEKPSDQKEMVRRVVHNLHEKKDSTVSYEGMQKKSGIPKWVNNMIGKCRKAIHYIQNKVRRVLRL